VNKTNQVALTPPKIILISLLLLVLFAVTTLGIVTFLVRNQREPAPAAAKPQGTGPTYPLESFNVNLADQESRHYLKATITLELSSPKVVTELDKRQAQIRDITITLLREKKAADLKAGNTAVIELKQQIQKYINIVLENGQVTAVYFTEFIVQ
jgi:flagellar FliL protein